jgi:putative transposase
MKGKRYSEEQIVQVLKEGQAGVGITEICRKYGISDASYYKWKTKYAGLEISDLRRLKQLEEENRRLKTMVAEQALDLQALKAVASKNW